MVLTRQRRLPFLRVLPTLVEDLLDIVGRSYDGIDYVVLHDIHETMLDPGESNHPLAAVGPTPASKLKGGYFWDGASPKGFPPIEWAPRAQPRYGSLSSPPILFRLPPDCRRLRVLILSQSGEVDPLSPINSSHDV